MLWSEVDIRTMRDNPAEAKSPAHALLVRAGYMRMPAAGAYEWLTPGMRSLEKIRGTPDFTKLGIECVETNGVYRAFSDFGPDPALQCMKCGYMDGVGEAVSRASDPPMPDPDTDAPPEEFYTPDRKTIADIAEFTGLPRSSQMKSLVMVVGEAPILGLVRGDHHLSRPKLARWTGAGEARAATGEEIRQWFGADAGSLGPIGIKNIRIVCDDALRGRRNMITGANRNDYHLRNVTPGRDFAAEFADIRQASENDRCFRCGEALRTVRTFVLSDPGSVLLAAAEQNRDEFGLRLPDAVAPFALIVTPVNQNDPAMRDAAWRIYRSAVAAGIETLYDDRDERPGVKFKDADLIGIPWRVTIGRRLAQGMVELRDRRAARGRDLPPEEVVPALICAREPKS